MVGTVQEEVGTRGAAMTAYEIAPDVGIAIDVTFGDFPGIPERDTAKLGKGGAVAIGPNFHPALTEKLMELAQEWEVPFQKEFIPRPGGTDAVSMQIAARGVPMVQVSIPLRYMHTTVETLDLKDIKRAARLLALFAAQLEQAHREVLG
jgi:endoglucanase